MNVYSKFFLIFFLFPVTSKGHIIVATDLPDQRGIFGVKVTGDDISETIITIPQCIGGLGIKVEDGNIYHMKVNSDCTYDASFNPIDEKRKQ